LQGPWQAQGSARAGAGQRQGRRRRTKSGWFRSASRSGGWPAAFFLPSGGAGLLLRLRAASPPPRRLSVSPGGCGLGAAEPAGADAAAEAGRGLGGSLKVRPCSVLAASGLGGASATTSPLWL
jgi:hypothetical protein